MRRRRFADGVFGQGARTVGATVVLAALAGSLLLLYRPLNHEPARWFLRTGLDDRIPLVRVMVVPYLSVFALAALTLAVLAASSARLCQSALLAVALTLAVSYLFYAFAQTEVLRPQVAGDDVLSRLLRATYTNDNPFNAFPSLHAGVSTVIAWHWVWLRRRSSPAVVVWCALVVASTVLVRQHYLADVAAGVALATAVSWLSRRIVERATPVRVLPGGQET